MRRCAQASQRSTCPPNAAVRQRSIADMTFSWPRLTWPAWDARHAGPRWRKMSATSTPTGQARGLKAHGRDNGGASAGHLQQQVERARHLADRAGDPARITVIRFVAPRMGCGWAASRRSRTMGNLEEHHAGHHPGHRAYSSAKDEKEHSRYGEPNTGKYRANLAHQCNRG